jgi:aspartate/methionine/tyrosine aminotransferase
MKDFLGNIIEIGDEVILPVPGYRVLTKAVIIEFTAKKVKVQYNNTWNYGNDGLQDEYLADPNILIKFKDLC